MYRFNERVAASATSTHLRRGRGNEIKAILVQAAIAAIGERPKH